VVIKGNARSGPSGKRMHWAQDCTNPAALSRIDQHARTWTADAPSSGHKQSTGWNLPSVWPASPAPWWDSKAGQERGGRFLLLRRALTTTDGRANRGPRWLQADARWGVGSRPSHLWASVRCGGV